MISYKTGAGLVIGGVFTKIIVAIITPFINIFPGSAYLGFFFPLLVIISWLLIVAGFALMWFCERDILDAAIAGCAALGAIISAIPISISFIVDLLIGATSALYLFVWTLKSFLREDSKSTTAVIALLGIWVMLAEPVINLLRVIPDVEAFISPITFFTYAFGCVLYLMVCFAAAAEKPR